MLKLALIGHLACRWFTHSVTLVISWPDDFAKIYNEITEQAQWSSGYA